MMLMSPTTSTFLLWAFASQSVSDVTSFRAGTSRAAGGVTSSWMPPWGASAACWPPSSAGPQAIRKAGSTASIANLFIANLHSSPE